MNTAQLIREILTDGPGTASEIFTEMQDRGYEKGYQQANGSIRTLKRQRRLKVIGSIPNAAGGRDAHIYTLEEK
jgi:hypothetical protein